MSAELASRVSFRCLRPAGGEVRIALRLQQVSGRRSVVLTVTDHGIGIPAADQARVFERYHRGSNVTGIRG